MCVCLPVCACVRVCQAIRIALCQAAPIQGSVRGNTLTARRLVASCAASADLVAFPELFLTGYDIGKAKLLELGMTKDDPAVTAFAGHTPTSLGQPAIR
jgi:predicted amidohydrolase